LSAIDPADVEHVRTFGIGTGLGSMIAPLVAMFVGGLVAGRLAGYYDRNVAGLHGALMWAIATLLGLVLAGAAVDALGGRMHGHDLARPAAGTRAFVDDAVARANQQLKAQHAPQVSADQVIDAARDVRGEAGAIDRDSFLARLDANTKLSRPEAEATLAAFGQDAPQVLAAAHEVARYRGQALAAAERTGKALLVAGIGLLLCLATAIAGALVGTRLWQRGREPAVSAPATTPPPPVSSNV
jgi:hypothetical protein